MLREHGITLGRLQPGVGGGGGGQGRQSLRAKAKIADYVLVYRNTLLAVIEAKAGAAAIGSALRPVLLSAGASLQTSALRRPIALGEVQQWVRLPAHTNDR